MSRFAVADCYAQLEIGAATFKFRWQWLGPGHGSTMRLAAKSVRSGHALHLEKPRDNEGTELRTSTYQVLNELRMSFPRTTRRNESGECQWRVGSKLVQVATVLLAAVSQLRGRRSNTMQPVDLKALPQKGLVGSCLGSYCRLQVPRRGDPPGNKKRNSI